jgi:hypothetical protein
VIGTAKTVVGYDSRPDIVHDQGGLKGITFVAVYGVQINDL